MTLAVRTIDDRGSGSRRLWWFAIVAAIAVATAATILFADVDRLVVGLLVIVLLLSLMLLTIPIGYAMLITAVVGLLALGGARAMESSVNSLLYDGLAQWTIAVVPLFVMMGIALSASGVTSRAYAAATQWLRWMPGGLAVATTMAGAGLATTSGSTTGISMALGRMAIPEMLRAGYAPVLATGSVAIAGTLGQIIPPSTLLVIYAGIAETAVGPQLLAGIVPGLLLAAGFALTIVVWALVRPGHAPRSAFLRSVTWRSRLRAAWGASPIALVAVVVIGGMAIGVFTANEAAAFGALTALLIGLVSLRQRRGWFRGAWRFMQSVTMDTVSSVAGIFILIVGALLLGRVLTLSGLASWLGRALVDLGLDRVGLLLVLIVVYVVLGMFLESLPMMVLTIPILQGPLEAVGVDMLWYGVFVIIMCEIGMVFPPIGLLTFIVHRLVQKPEVGLGMKISLADVFRGIMPFMVACVGLTILFILLPEIVLWLPETVQQLTTGRP